MGIKRTVSKQHEVTQGRGGVQGAAWGAGGLRRGWAGHQGEDKEVELVLEEVRGHWRRSGQGDRNKAVLREDSSSCSTQGMTEHKKGAGR